MSILITGGRGKIARAVHAGLTAQGHAVRVASREPADLPGAIALNPAHPVSLANALDGITQVFLYADPATAELFVEAAENAGVKQVVLLSSLSAQAADATSDDGTDDPAGDPHIGAERVISGGAYATTRLQPGTFMSNASYWSYQLRATGQIRLPYLDAEEAPIHEQDIADVALKVLLDGPGGAHDGATYPMTGPESMTRRRQLGLIAEVTGVPVEVVELTPEQAFEEMSSTMRDPARLALLTSYWASRVGSPHPLEPTVEAPHRSPGPHLHPVVAGQPNRLLSRLSGSPAQLATGARETSQKPAYRPPRRSSSPWLPSSTTRPPSRKAMRSARCTVRRRCATITTVRPAIRRSIPSWTAASFTGSRADVTSSSSTMGASFSSARAIETR